MISLGSLSVSFCTDSVAIFTRYERLVSLDGLYNREDLLYRGSPKVVHIPLLLYLTVLHIFHSAIRLCNQLEALQ